MEFSVKTSSPEQQKTSCYIVFISKANQLTGIAKDLDAKSKGHIRSIFQQGDISGTHAETLLLHKVPHLAAERLLLVGIGLDKELSARQFILLFKTIFSFLKEKNITDATIDLDEYKITEDLSWKIKQCIMIHSEINYRLDSFKSKPMTKKSQLKKICFISKTRKNVIEGKLAIKQGVAIANGMALTKDLVNTPPNFCNPGYLEKKAKSLSKTYSKLKVTALNKKQLQKLKMGALLAVGQGSKNDPKLITLEYRGTSASKKPYVLVGKGITFDTGGNSLKPSGAMVGMKYDMGGAASVLGTILAVCELKLPINVVGVLSVAENMPGADAQRPDDIITSMKGTTIEVLNTDAEGRLVLCDALTYVERFKPAEVVDIATLTGAISVALGKFKAGLFSNNDKLATSLFNSGETISDPCWRLPIGPEYKEQLQSNFADLTNISDSGTAGSITAACFLSHFAEKYPWAHLDIAGVATTGSKGKAYGTGRPVPLLSQYLINKC